MPEAQEILVEVIDTRNVTSTEKSALDLLEGDATQISRPIDAVAKQYAAIPLEQIRSSIIATGQTALAAIEALSPQACQVEFSLGFKAGAGLPVLVSGEANGALKVTLKWSKPGAIAPVDAEGT